MIKVNVILSGSINIFFFCYFLSTFILLLFAIINQQLKINKLIKYKLRKSLLTNQFSKLIHLLLKYRIFISNIMQIYFICLILQFSSVKTSF